MFLRTFLDWSLLRVNDKRFWFFLTLVVIKLFLLFHVYLWSCVLHWWLELVVQHFKFKMGTFVHWCLIVNDIWTVLLTLLLIVYWRSFAYLRRWYFAIVDFLKLWAFYWPFDWFLFWVHEWLLLLLHVNRNVRCFHFCYLLVLKELDLYTFWAFFDWAFIALLIIDLHFLCDNNLIDNWTCFASARRRAWLTFIEMLAYLFWSFDWTFLQGLNSCLYFLFALNITYFYFVVWMHGRNMTFHTWFLWFLVDLVLNRCTLFHRCFINNRGCFALARWRWNLAFIESFWLFLWTFDWSWFWMLRDRFLLYLTPIFNEFSSK